MLTTFYECSAFVHVLKIQNRLCNGNKYIFIVSLCRRNLIKSISFSQILFTMHIYVGLILFQKPKKKWLKLWLKLTITFQTFQKTVSVIDNRHDAAAFPNETHEEKEEMEFFLLFGTTNVWTLRTQCSMVIVIDVDAFSKPLLKILNGPMRCACIKCR